jgi:hypothetical protein
MPPELYTEYYECELCGEPAAVWFKRDRTAQGTLVRPIAQRIKCVNGCVGRGVFDPSRSRRIT